MTITENPIQILAQLGPDDLNAAVVERLGAIPEEAWLNLFPLQEPPVQHRIKQFANESALIAAILKLTALACDPQGKAEAKMESPEMVALAANAALMSAVLFLAAANGWSALLDRWLSIPRVATGFGVNPNHKRDSKRMSEFDIALCSACRAGHLGCVATMLRYGADPECWWGPLTAAAQNNHAAVVQYMLDNCDLCEETKFQALFFGNRAGALDCVRALIGRVDLDNDEAGYELSMLYDGNACSYLGYHIDTANNEDPACRQFLIEWAREHRAVSRPLWHTLSR